MFKTLRTTWMIPIVGIVLVGFIGCETDQELQGLLDAFGQGQEKPVNGPDEPKETSAAVVDVIQGTASPGMTVRVVADQPAFDEQGLTQVTIGGQTASILTRFDPMAVKVLVPLLPPGVVDVQVIEPGKLPGTPGALNVLRPHALQLHLSLLGDALQLNSAEPTPGGYRRDADGGGRRIQYVVYNKLGRIVHSNAVNHPTQGRREVFQFPTPDQLIMRRVPNRVSGDFIATIPNVPGGVLVRFYDVPADADLRTQEGLAARALIKEINIGG